MRFFRAVAGHPVPTASVWIDQLTGDRATGEQHSQDGDERRQLLGNGAHAIT
jgi:hypothetical protein